MATITNQIPGLVLTDHLFQLPLDHANPAGEQISVYAREVVATEKRTDQLPWLVFLQGGPGGKSPRPFGRSGWLRRATDEYRVLLLDQRGTGRSSPITHQTLGVRGTPEVQAAYLRHFRADSIVRDAELIRAELLGPEQPWSALGQSYGGFCLLTYLSIAPQGLREAFFTGGLAPLDRSAEEVYRKTYLRVREQNRRYFARYPHDQAQAQAIASHVAEHAVHLPNGDRLTPHAFQYLGLLLGASDGFEHIHYILEEAFVAGQATPQISETFLHEVMAQISFAQGPLFAILHEPIYAQGAATNWAAERVRAEYPEFNWRSGQPFLFTGEMIYPWMFEEDRALRPTRAAAELLAAETNWPALYDLAQLHKNHVPCAAAVYYDDMYVERAFSEETAATLNNCRVWITNEYQHNALRADGERVLGRLIDLMRGK
jgi:pimeloyl-ACP methyl ester carboxylesterase